MKKAIAVVIVFCLAAVLVCGCQGPALPSDPDTQPTQTTVPSTYAPIVPTAPNTGPATYPVYIPTRPAEETAYREAEILLAEGKTAEAAIAFGKLAGYDDARERSFALWRTVVNPHTIAMSACHNFALSNSGTVLCAGEAYMEDDSGFLEYQSVTEAVQWQDVISIDAYNDHIIALHSDGTVSVRCDNHTCTGTESWTDIIAVAAGQHYFAGLKIDGTVVSTANNFFSSYVDMPVWTDIVSIDIGHSVTVAQNVNGAVLAFGSNLNGESEVDGWENVTKIVSNGILTLGLCRDGTVLAAGAWEQYKAGIRGWKDIVDLWLTDYGPIGLRADGTLAWFHSEETEFLQEWTDIVDICGDNQRIFGLCADGTVCLGGFIISEVEESAYWNDICLP